MHNFIHYLIFIALSLLVVWLLVIIGELAVSRGIARALRNKQFNIDVVNCNVKTTIERSVADKK